MFADLEGGGAAVSARDSFQNSLPCSQQERVCAHFSGFFQCFQSATSPFCCVMLRGSNFFSLRGGSDFLALDAVVVVGGAG